MKPGLPDRVLIVGLDGATWDLLDPMMARGVMPNLKSLVESGGRGTLESVFPPITAPAWSSIYTGTNPGKHGVYDFMRRLPGQYEVAPVDASFRDGKSVFRLVSEAGGQVFALNPPLTYPGEELNGAIVPGLPTPGFSISPAALAERFLAAVPGYDPYPAEFGHLVGKTAELPGMARHYVEQCIRAFRFLSGEFAEWRLGMIHFQVTDVAMHFAWGDEQVIDAVYREVDAGLGEILADLPEHTTVLVISDHGHGSLDALLHVNEWLRQQGYLRFKRGPVSSAKSLAYRLGLNPTRAYSLALKLGLRRVVQKTVHERPENVRGLLRRMFVSFDDVDWERTRAYSVGNAGQIYMNVKGRDPRGCILPERLDAEIDSLAADLRAMRDPRTGKALVAEVHRGSELYHGPRTVDAPDLLWIPADFGVWAFAQNQFASSQWLAPVHDGRTGHHRMTGIIATSGHAVRERADLRASLFDVTPTVLSLLGVPLPSYLDGRVVEEAFLPELGLLAGSASSEEELSSGSRSGYSEDDAELVAKRLDDLGYL